jgi:hypothetical protein
MPSPVVVLMVFVEVPSLWVESFSPMTTHAGGVVFSCSFGDGVLSCQGAAVFAQLGKASGCKTVVLFIHLLMFILFYFTLFYFCFECVYVGVWNWRWVV